MFDLLVFDVDQKISQRVAMATLLQRASTCCQCMKKFLCIANFTLWSAVVSAEQQEKIKIHYNRSTLFINFKEMSTTIHWLDTISMMYNLKVGIKSKL